MRQTLGLPRAGGITPRAHGISQLSAARVVLMRAARSMDRRLLSRWLLSGAGEGPPLSLVPERPWIAWARRAMPFGAAVQHPAKRRWARPRHSRHGDREWISGPCAIFAQLLGLGAAETGRAAGPSLRGQIVRRAGAPAQR
jgi:hypothetical protein